MVERLFTELFPCVVEHSFRQGCVGNQNVVDCLRFRRFETFLVAEEGGDIARLGGPAIGIVC